MIGQITKMANKHMKKCSLTNNYENANAKMQVKAK